MGQVVADIGVTGVATGNAVLSLSHASLVEPAEAVVTVRAGAGSQMYYSAPVGITRGVPWAVAHSPCCLWWVVRAAAVCLVCRACAAVTVAARGGSTHFSLCI